MKAAFRLNVDWLIDWFTSMSARWRLYGLLVHTDERTHVHSTQSSLVTHLSTNWARRYLTLITESPSKHWSPHGPFEALRQIFETWHANIVKKKGGRTATASVDMTFSLFTLPNSVLNKVINVVHTRITSWLLKLLNDYNGLYTHHIIY